MSDDPKPPFEASKKSTLQVDQDLASPVAGQSIPHAISSPTQLGDQLAQIHALGAQAAATRRRVAMAPYFRVNTRQAAKYLGVCKRTMENWREQEIGPPYIQYESGGKVWYELRDLARWATEQPTGRYSLGQLPAPLGPADMAEQEGTEPAIGNLTRAQTARYLGISLRMLDSWRGQPGKPQPKDSSIKKLRYCIVELDAFVEAHTHGN